MTLNGVLILAAALAPTTAPAAAQFTPRLAPTAVLTPRANAEPVRLFETCTREGTRKGRYSEYTWCEWFSYFHQNK